MRYIRRPIPEKKLPRGYRYASVPADTTNLALFLVLLLLLVGVAYLIMSAPLLVPG